MDYVIFPAGPDDAEALAEVHIAAWRESYRGLIADSYLDRMSPGAHARRFAGTRVHPPQDSVTLAAASRNGIVGYVAGGPSRRARPAEAEVQTLYVRLSAQRAGLGRHLMRAAARVLAAHGARSLMVSTLRDNLPARRFYERLGGAGEPPRSEPGPGGVHVEVRYVWADIGGIIL